MIKLQTFRFAAAMLAAVAPAFAQTKAKAQNVAEIPYDSAPNFLKLPPNLYLGEGIGVATNSKGHIFVYTRSARARACSSSIRPASSSARSAKDFTDSSSRTRCASIRRTTSGPSTRARTWSSSSIPTGRVVMVLGHRPDAVEGWSRKRPRRSSAAGELYVQAARPTSPGTPQGNIFVSDGYGNSRVVKYDKNGTLHQLRSAREGTGQGQFNLPHAIATDAQGQRVRRGSQQPPDCRCSTTT